MSPWGLLAPLLSQFLLASQLLEKEPAGCLWMDEELG